MGTCMLELCTDIRKEKQMIECLQGSSEEFASGCEQDLTEGLEVALTSLAILWQSNPLHCRIEISGYGNEGGPCVSIYLYSSRVSRRQLIFEKTHFGRDRKSLDDAIILESRFDFLDNLFRDNIPQEAGYTTCDCEEYCDNRHGDGPIIFVISKPNAHEIAEAVQQWGKLNDSLSNGAVHSA